MIYSSVLPQRKHLGGGRKVEKVPPPYYCTSAGHHVLGKKCVFIAGSFLKKSVFKAGTTVFINLKFQNVKITRPKLPITEFRNTFIGNRDYWWSGVLLFLPFVRIELII